MATPVAQVVKVNWKLVFPWLALFRAFGLALHVRQVFVGVIAVLLIAISEWSIAAIPFPRNAPPANLSLDWISWIWGPWVDLAYPMVPPWLLRPVSLSVHPTMGWGYLLQSLLRLVVVLVVGGLAGGVLVRRAGLEFAREETVGLLTTIRFVSKRSIDYLSAPALPLAVVGALAAVLWLMGLLARLIPGASYVLSAIWGPILVAGVVMSVLLIAIFLSWPLMIAAVSLNSGDGFDALSRGFGFVLDRWRYYAWCLIVMALYGLVSFLIVLCSVRYGEYLAMASLEWNAYGWGPRGLPRILPGELWNVTIAILFRGFGYSFFWSSMAIIYLVLRQSLDNAELHDVYVDGAPQSPDNFQNLVNPTQPEPPPPTLLPIINQP